MLCFSACTVKYHSLNQSTAALYVEPVRDEFIDAHVSALSFKVRKCALFNIDYLQRQLKGKEKREM